MLRRLSSLLLVIALAVAGLIPAGWMPAAASGGKVLMVICTGESMVETWVDLGPGGDGSPSAPPHEAGDRSCPFAAAPASALLPAAQLLPGPEGALAARFAHEAFTHHSAGFHRRYDARGPPALS